MWRRSLIWIGFRPADNPADNPDDDEYAKAHGDILTAVGNEVKFIIF
jgi:hypothetical protein